MNTLKILSPLGKIDGIAITAVAPFGAPRIGIYVFIGASILKDAVNHLGGMVDDEKESCSFKG